MNLRVIPNLDLAEAGAVLAKAVVRAASQLNVTAKVLASVLGLSEPSISRMKRGEYALEPATKPFEFAVLFVRMFRSLDAIVGGDVAVARAWLDNDNTALNGRPVDKIQSISGLMDVIAYLDARRALI
jgi:hypothetical protein